MKPSEQFAELKSVVEGMDEGKDKTDLLALFKLADGLHHRVKCFGKMVGGVKRQMNLQDREIADLCRWRRKWKLLLMKDNSRKGERQ